MGTTEFIVKYEFIDYSGVYYRIIAEKPIPRRRSGKFVQIVNEDLDRSCLVLAPAEMAFYHANIVERFCRLGKIDGSYTSAKSCFKIDDPEWRVTGGGKWVVDDVEKSATFFDRSRMYGPYDPMELHDALRSAGVLDGYRVTVLES